MIDNGNIKPDGYTPPFTVSAKAISMVAKIAALTERFAIRLERHDALLLRRANKIKTIHSSLAIEGNTLTESQVSDLLDGKRVVAPMRQIQEVKNAIATYDLATTLNPFSSDDLLKAHEILMSALVGEPGRFRRGGVGVFADKQLVHMAPPAERVQLLIADLFDWLTRAEDHLLIRSCVFHYEFEFIHPFADGNGHMGRLWQSLILGRLHQAFLALPVETMIHHNQQEYYAAINASTSQSDCGVFIDFMLTEIWQALKVYEQTSTTFSDEATPQVTLQVTPQVTPQVRRLLAKTTGEMSRSELMAVLVLKDRANFAKKYLEPALAADLIAMTQPDSPKSPTQKYRLTEKGRKVLATRRLQL
jgi:Fic family protein